MLELGIMNDAEKLEKLLKVVANRRRIKILQFLKRNREANVRIIAEAIELSFKATSKHLAKLRSLDIIERHQVSLEVWYRLSKTQHAIVNKLLSLL